MIQFPNIRPLLKKQLDILSIMMSEVSKAYIQALIAYVNNDDLEVMRCVNKMNQVLRKTLSEL